LPPGVLFHTYGVTGKSLWIYGTPTEPGTYTLEILLTDTKDCNKIVKDTIVITEDNPCVYTRNNIGKRTFDEDKPIEPEEGIQIGTAKYGKPPYTFTIKNLPIGLSYKTTGDLNNFLWIYGTPTTPGKYKVEILLTDAGECNTVIIDEILIVKVVITYPCVLTIVQDTIKAKVGSVVTDIRVAKATLGIPPYSWVDDKGSLPSLPYGYSWSVSGLNNRDLYINGTVVTADPGTYTVSLFLKDADVCLKPLSITIIVEAKPECKLEIVPVDGVIELQEGATLSSSITTLAIMSSGTVTTGYTWVITGLPSSLEAKYTGTNNSVFGYSGTLLTNPPGNYVVSITGADNDGCSKTKILKVVIIPVKECELHITDESISIEKGQDLKGIPILLAEAKYGHPPYSWSWEDPDGILSTLEFAKGGTSSNLLKYIGGVVSTSVGTYTVTIVITDSKNCSKTGIVVFDITGSVSSCKIYVLSKTTFSLTQGDSFSQYIGNASSDNGVDDPVPWVVTGLPSDFSWEAPNYTGITLKSSIVSSPAGSYPVTISFI
jgi:hypothetical protein